MNGRLAVLASRYAGRPVLMTPRAAEDLVQRIRDADSRAFERPGRLQALFRGLRGAQARERLAMEDDYDGPPPVPFEEKAAYAPLYIGEPEDLGYCWALKDGVALMQADTALTDRGEEFCGTVYHGYDTLLAGMREARADDRVKAIFIRMACPGGVVAGGLGELAAWMRANRAAAGGKPIHVYADMACSAAYWIAAQADHIAAPRVGLVGSIGAVIVHEDWSAALEKAGVKITAVQFGKLKTDGAWWEALSPTAKDALQAEIDQCGRDFVADVVAGREKLTEEALLATEAAVYMANHDDSARSGLALGFVDEICGEESAFSALAAQVSDPQSLGLPSPAASGGRAALDPAKEKPMALRPTTTAGRTAAVQAAEAALASAQANLAKARAEAEGGDDTQEGGGGDDTVEGGEGNDTIEAGAGDDALSGGEGDDAATGSDASAIAASAEAKSHPQLALAAIQSGQTLAQFKANVAAAGAPKGVLASAMAGAQRLGPDGAKADAQPLKSAAQIYAANREKGLSAKRR